MIHNKLLSIFPCLSYAKLYKIKVFVKLSICKHKYIILNEEYDAEKECLASANAFSSNQLINSSLQLRVIWFCSRIIETLCTSFTLYKKIIIFKNYYYKISDYHGREKTCSIYSVLSYNLMTNNLHLQWIPRLLSGNTVK